jgi:hypothetical protein
MACQVARGDSAPASYTEPASTRLAGLATFDMPQPQWSPTPQGQELRYALPADLVGGKDVEIELFGTVPVIGQGFVPFSGDLAHAECTLTSKTHVLCFIQYTRDTFGPDPDRFSADAKEFLSGKYAGEPDLSKRLEVQADFQNEPAGVLSFQLVR